MARPEWGGTREELESIFGYRDALRRLKKAYRDKDNDGEHEDPKGGGKGKDNIPEDTTGT